MKPYLHRALVGMLLAVLFLPAFLGRLLQEAGDAAIEWAERES